MTANIITFCRILLSFLVVFLYQWSFSARVIAVGLTIVVILLDSLDGLVARKLGESSDFGALFDISGDRIVEHVFWIFFAARGLISFWVPVIFVGRSFLVDTLRSVAYAREGKTPFGEKSMMKSPFTRFLTASPFSRSTYAFGKVLVFVLLGCILAYQAGFETLSQWLPPTFLGNLIFVTELMTWIVVAMNLIRGLPVLWDGRQYLFEKQFPRKFRSDA